MFNWKILLKSSKLNQFLVNLCLLWGMRAITKFYFFIEIDTCIILTLSCSANERTEMKLKIYLSEAWMCSEFGMLITDVERERVNIDIIF